MSRRVAIIAEVLQQSFGMTTEDLRARGIYEQFEAVADNLAQLFGEPVIPTARESVVVSDTSPKLAALFYDRVWAGAAPDVPESIRFFGGTDIEVRLLALLTAARSWPDAGADMKTRAPILQRHMEAFFDIVGHPPQPNASISERFVRAITVGIEREHGISPVAQFVSRQAQELAYAPGKYEVLVAALSNVPVIAPDDLTWEQVLELRKDLGARRALRRFVHWLDKELVGQTATFIADEVAERLEQYQNASRKHGMRLIVGALSSILDSKVLAGGAAAVASLSFAKDPVVGLLAGAAVVGANAAVHIARSLIDLDETRVRTSREVSFVLEVQKRSGGTA